MPQVEGIEQQTPEWLQIRCGNVTASRVADVVSRLKVKSKNGEKGDPSAKCLGYRDEIVFETLTGKCYEHYVSPHMDFGSENEPLACAAYEHATESEVVPGGFWLHDRIPRLGASPDGLVGEDGLVEYKCPPAQHVSILKSKQVPEPYLWQIQTELACTGRQWCDFVSYLPDMPKALKIFIKRVPRDNALIAAIEEQVVQFLESVVAEIKALEQ